MSRRSAIFIAFLGLLITILGSVLIFRGMGDDESEAKTSEVYLAEAPKRYLSRVSYEEWKNQNPDRATFVDYFSKDANSVYWYHGTIVGADAGTFDTYDNWYARDSKTVYYQGYTRDGSGNDVYIIRGADVATFRALGNTYAKDKNHAYFKGEEVVGADPETFEEVGQPGIFYAKDKNSVYRDGEKSGELYTADFRILDKSGTAVYMIDSERVLLEAWFIDGSKREIRVVEGADPETFEVVRGVWGKDRNSVYYGAHRIENSDPGTLEVLGAGNEDLRSMMYAKDESGVYYTFKRIENADSKTFQAVEEVWVFPGNYGEDKYSAYRDGQTFPKQDLAFFKRGELPPAVKSLGSRYFQYENKVYYYPESVQSVESLGLIDADLENFRVLRSGYARDDKRVYYKGVTISEDPSNTFEILQDSYSKDAKGVYYESKKIDGADPSTFSFIRNSYFTMDKNSVYFLENYEVKKTGADVATFQVVLGSPGNYGKDSRNVFIGDRVLESAIPQSFRYLDSGYSKDSESVFFGEKKISNADPVSFTVLGDGLSSDEGYHGSLVYYSYAKDKEHVFCEADILSGADIKTFILKGKNGMPQDKFHRYNWCETIE